MSAPSMRERFVEVAAAELERDERVAVVLADISVDRFEGCLAEEDRDRIVNVGIREQALIGVTAGLALEGMRPVAHSYASFLVERPFEQIKLDLGHQDVGAVLVSIGASYDDADAGRTHHAPGDVALLATLPDWTIHVPGHPDEAAALVGEAIRADGRVYIRLSDETNAEAFPTTGLQVVRRGEEGSPLILAVGPALAAVLEATADRDATIAYTATVRPFPAAELRTLVRGPEVALVEPTLAGTSAGELARALSDLPTRQLSVGVTNTELRRYGTHEEHRAAHGLDAAGVAAALAAFLEQPVGAVS
jgi:transketolase